MYKILINHKTGEQGIEYIDISGSYFDQSSVLWDERIDGVMPTVTLGKMIRIDDSLIEQVDFLPDYATWMALQQTEDNKAQRVELIRQSANTDEIVNQLRSMTEIEIDAWCDSNITSISDLKMLMKKIIRILIVMNEGK